MSYVIDTAPLPEQPPTLRSMIEALTPGQSLLAPETTIASLKVTASRVRSEHRERVFKTHDTTDGPRVWRLS